MRKFDCILQTEVSVDFSNPERVMKEITKSNWRDTFFDIDDIGGVAEHLSYAFLDSEEHWDSTKKAHFRFLEGFGYFHCQPDGSYQNEVDAVIRCIGVITIRTDDELEIASCDEMS